MLTSYDLTSGSKDSCKELLKTSASLMQKTINQQTNFENCGLYLMLSYSRPPNASTKWKEQTIKPEIKKKIAGGMLLSALMCLVKEQEKQDGEVVQMTQPTDAENKISKELKNYDSDAEFNRKKKWLAEKWSQIKWDSNEKRLMQPIVFRTNTPINNSILADDLEYFKEHYKADYGQSLEKAFARSCLCGSEKITEFLLEKLGADYTSEKYAYVLSYAAASENRAWVKKIATAMAEKQISMPESVYSLIATPQMLDSIKRIFNYIPVTKPAI